MVSGGSWVYERRQRRLLSVLSGLSGCVVSGGFWLCALGWLLGVLRPLPHDPRSPCAHAWPIRKHRWLRCERRLARPRAAWPL